MGSRYWNMAMTVYGIFTLLRASKQTVTKILANMTDKQNEAAA